MTRHAREAGQAMPEYLIACAVLVVALLLPWNGQASVLAQLAASLRGYVRTAVYLVSLF